MNELLLHKEKENKRKGTIISIILHVLLLLLLIIPFVKKVEFPKAEGGILVQFGDPNAGNFDTPISENSASEKKIEEETKPVTHSNSDNTKVVSKTSEDISAVKSREQEARKKSEAELKKEAEQKKLFEAQEAERKRKEQAAKDQAKLDNKKKELSDLFGKGAGSGGQTGNQGDSKGDPSGKVLDGISKGSGRIGGGLSGRGVEYEPTFKDNSQKTGIVVLTICVGSNGKVISSKFTQRGSTTSDTYLIQLAENTAKNYKFSKSDIDSQCGTVSVDFRVQ